MISLTINAKFDNFVGNNDLLWLRFFFVVVHVLIPCIKNNLFKMIWNDFFSYLKNCLVNYYDLSSSQSLLVIELLTSQQAKLTHHHTGSSSFSFVCNSHLILRWVTLSWSSNSHSDLTSISFPFFLMNDTPILSSIGFNIYFPLNHTLMLLSVWITSLIIMDSHAICSD